MPSTSTTTFSYDAVGRLTQAAWSGTSYAYGYGTTTGCAANNAGANTNRTSETITGTGAGSVSYCYNSGDQLTSYTVNGGNPDTSYSYDADGNNTNDGGTTVTWDSANRLASTTNSSGTTTTYTYDPVDRVVEQQDGTTTTEYSYSGMTTVAAAILNSSGNLVDSLVPLPGGVTVTVPAAGLTSSVWSYSNMQGDTTLTCTNSGAPQGGPLAYDPWGVPMPLLGGQPLGNTPAGSPSLAAYGAQGKLTDPNNNLITMGARPFSPAEGRFLTVDALHGGCANPYTYGFGDPLNSSDLNGHGELPSCAGINYTEDGVNVQVVGWACVEAPGGVANAYIVDVNPIQGLKPFYLTGNIAVTGPNPWSYSGGISTQGQGNSDHDYGGDGPVGVHTSFVGLANSAYEINITVQWEYDILPPTEITIECVA